MTLRNHASIATRSWRPAWTKKATACGAATARAVGPGGEPGGRAPHGSQAARLRYSPRISSPRAPRAAMAGPMSDDDPLRREHDRLIAEQQTLLREQRRLEHNP